MVRVKAKAKNIIVAAVLGVGMFDPARQLFADAKRTVQSLRSSSVPDDIASAGFLLDNGLRPGDKVATVGYSFEAFYAHIAGLQIAAQVLDADEFSHASATDFDQLLGRLRAIGVRAIVVRERPPYYNDVQWREFCLSNGSRLDLLML